MRTDDGFGGTIEQAFTIKVTPYSLTAYYPFNGNADDESGNGHHGTVNGALLTTDRFGSQNSAYSFDGIDDYIDMGNGVTFEHGHEKLTIAAWIYLYGPAEGIQYTIAGPQPGFSFTVMGDNLWVNYYHEGSHFSFAGGGSIEVGVWQFVAVTYDGIVGRLYINDEMVIADPVSGDIDLFDTNLIVGSMGGPIDVLNGKIDDILIFNRALSEEEIISLFMNGMQSPWLDDDEDGDGYTENQGDCDDSDPLASPEGIEVCDDGIDNDCNGNPDCNDDECSCSTWYRDSDGDGYGDLNDSKASVSQPGGYVGNSDDWDDTDPTVYPSAAEICGDGKDNDQNGEIDEGCPIETYPSADPSKTSELYRVEVLVDDVWVDTNAYQYLGSRKILSGTTTSIRQFIGLQLAYQRISMQK